jgi:hypothetical protein
MKRLFATCIAATMFAVIAAGSIPAAWAADEAPLSVGWATVDITPPKPVPLAGQMSLRVSQGVDDPLTATVLALETRSADGKPIDQAILVSCDLGFVPGVVQQAVQERVKGRLKDFDAAKLFMNATHTHTAPDLVDSMFRGLYDVSKHEGVMKASEYSALLVDRLADAAVAAWNARKPGAMSWALGQAVVSHNRRATYFDGHAQMYGNTSQDDFQSTEGGEDHGLPLLFFWSPEKKLTGIIVNIACPSQETESRSTVSADFWHEVRQELHKRYGPDVAVLPQCSAAGDLSPHLQWRKQAEAIMLQRKGISSRQEIAERIAEGVDRVFPQAKTDIKDKIVFRHEVALVELPTKQPPDLPFYENDSVAPIEFHVLRLGDVAMATNPFELYLDYGVRMRARSKAPLTCLVQLSCRVCGYLPTAKAVAGGGYSADKFIVGPEGGQVLVNETVRRINAMWE